MQEVRIRKCCSGLRHNCTSYIYIPFRQLTTAPRISKHHNTLWLPTLNQWDTHSRATMSRFQELLDAVRHLGSIGTSRNNCLRFNAFGEISRFEQIKVGL